MATKQWLQLVAIYSNVCNNEYSILMRLERGLTHLQMKVLEMQEFPPCHQYAEKQRKNY